MKTPKWWMFGKHLLVMHSTGPLCLTNAINQYTRTVCRISWKIFNANLIDTSSTSSQSVLISLDGGSWHAFDTTMFNFCYKHYQILILIISILFVLLVQKFWRKCSKCCIAASQCLLYSSAKKSINST